MKQSWLVLVLLGALSPSLGADSLPFRHGVNLTGWMQGYPAHQLPLAKFGPKDLADLKSLGVDGVRLPVDFGEFVGPAPQFRLDPLALSLLDLAVDRIVQAGLAVVIDNHGDPTDLRWKFDLSGYLEALWSQLSEHYQNQPEAVVYEIQNEPHDISSSDWDRVQRRALASIRKREPNRTVVVTGADWGGISGLLSQTVYADPHLVYSFHYYDPMVFTHQGASWTGLTDLTGVAFPPRGKAPPLADSLRYHWGAKGLRDYYSSDPAKTMEASFNAVAAYSRDHGVSLWCGEFGVYNKNADSNDRVTWYSAVRQFLETHSIPWTMWDYRDSFGLYQKGSAEVFDQDLNLPLVEALGFRAPPQQKIHPILVEGTTWLYRDQGEVVGPPSSWSPNATCDYFATGSAAEGPFFLRWGHPARYSYVAWNLAPLRDLSSLATRSNLVLQVRTSARTFEFDVRLVDSWEKESGRLPWRKSFTVTQNLVPGDGQWHAVSIPLADLKESGAWDGSWHPGAPGTFDLSRVARIELVAETAALPNVDLDIDEVGLSVQP